MLRSAVAAGRIADSFAVRPFRRIDQLSDFKASCEGPYLVGAQRGARGNFVMTETASAQAALLLYPKRFWLLAITVLMLSTAFWTSSRYPHLFHLAEATQGFEATSLVSPEPLLAIAPDAAYLEKVALNTVNWLYDNRIGMGFGLLLGTLLLTLLRTVGRPRSTNTYLNTAYGILLGAPLGVCVNCAAPIAAGMSRGGGALVTSLSTMFSAPTLNVIA